jgi:hypothetical protein
MGNRIAVMLSALRYARESGRELVVDWNDHTYFSPGIADVFSSLWESPETPLVAIRELEGLSVYPTRWLGKLNKYRNALDAEIMPYALAWSKPPDELDADQQALARDSDVIVLTRDGAKRLFAHLYSELRPSPSIRLEIEAFAEGHEWNKTIGVQIRHGNGERYLTPASTSWFHERIDVIRRRIGDGPVCLSTDSDEVVMEFVQKYPKIIHYPKWYPAIGSGPMHHHPECPDRFESGRAAIIDMWLLAKCSHLLVCDGGFGRTALHRSVLGPESVERYPDKIYASVAEKSDWDNPI